MYRMNAKYAKYKRFQPMRLRFPKHLDFKPFGDGKLVCNRKTVMVVPSNVIQSKDYPPTDIEIKALGIHNFNLDDVDCYIFSYANQSNLKTECAIVPTSVLLKNQLHRIQDGKIKIKLFLSSRGLFEYRDSDGAEFLFMGLWLDENRNFTEHYNNWSFFR